MPEIETDRLLLRPITMQDVDALQAAVYADDEATRYLPGGKAWPLSETRSLVAWWVGHWQARNFGPFAVIDKQTGAFLGDAGLMYMISAGHVIELMYAFGRSAWGKGIATEAVRAAVRHGFETVGLTHITALADPANIASRRVMEKIGMTFEGINARYYGADLAVYTLKREAFDQGDGLYQLKT